MVDHREDRLQCARILIVDDEPGCIRLLEKILSSYGYSNLISTTDPRQVLPLYLEHRPDLVLLDLMMPDLDGFGGLDQLGQATPESAYVPVVVLSGAPTRETKQRAMAAGAKDFLSKPFEVTDILLRIRNALHTRFLHLELQRDKQVLEARVREQTRDLEQAQKLEAVGRLAAGIAHEINTPIQFIGDNVQFLREAFDSLDRLLDTYRELRASAEAGSVDGALLVAVRTAEEAADLAYLTEEVPKALAQTLEGVERVATIVRAMKEFARPGEKERKPTDINRAVLSTLVVARNELKYVADVETELGEIPPVLCQPSDVNQVLLNLLVNAADAIADAPGRDGQKGMIRVRTAREGDSVVISVGDTGCGIPEQIRAKVFDHFFTTKEVGRGTGQGLSLARAIVVEQHGGSLTFESEVGRGTTFHVRLPIDGPKTARAA